MAALSKEAAMDALRRTADDQPDPEEIPQEVLDKLQVERDDFKDALKRVQPSAMREVMIEMPDVNWEDVGGLDDVKQDLQEAVEWPLKYRECSSGCESAREGRPPVWAAGHGQDAAGEGGGARVGGELHRSQGAQDALQMGWRIGAADQSRLFARRGRWHRR